jgi:hypothetical protein
VEHHPQADGKSGGKVKAKFRLNFDLTPIVSTTQFVGDFCLKLDHFDSHYLFC